VVAGTPRSDDGETAHDLWSMGAVSRHTGIGEHTLRAWERRFGFPDPNRLPSGHRRYTSHQVRQLAMIAKALDRGYRAGDVVPLSFAELEDLLRESGALAAEAGRGAQSVWIAAVMDATSRLDRNAVIGLLHREAAGTGLRVFLRERVAPLLEEVGEAWRRGDLRIRHEHFLSEVLEDVLRGIRSDLELAAAGEPVILATPPSESHALGLELAALTIMSSGRAVRMLGADIPVEEIEEAADAVGAIAVGLSVSLATAGEEVAAAVARLRELLDDRVVLWVGGSGAGLLRNLPTGVRVVDSLVDLEAALHQLPPVVAAEV
jgi:DNA-binding transcriptional MerR regulator/methylmalonyl-CoA mutase cobalamin-binding subunit